MTPDVSRYGGTVNGGSPLAKPPFFAGLPLHFFSSQGFFSERRQTIYVAKDEPRTMLPVLPVPGFGKLVELTCPFVITIDELGNKVWIDIVVV